MHGFIKREKHSIPFLPEFPKMTPEYKAAMEDLFFSRNISPSDIKSGDMIIVMGSPIMIKEQVYAIGSMPVVPDTFLIVSGGVSPAYEKFSPEGVGAATIEIFKGTFGFDIKEPEAVRVFTRLEKKFPNLHRIGMLETRSTNTYENIKESWELRKYAPLLKRAVLLATIEQIPRAIETLKTIAGDEGEKIEITGMPLNPRVRERWHKSLWQRSRFAAEVKRLENYSNKENPKIKNPISLADMTRAKLDMVLELSK